MQKILKQKDIRPLREQWLNIQKGKDAAIPTLEVENPTLDHDHTEGYCRGVLDREVNQFLGKVESAYKRFIRHKGISLEMALDGISDYLRRDFSGNPLHPEHVKSLCRVFARVPAKVQIIRIAMLGLTPSLTKDGRLKQYKKYLTNESNSFKINSSGRTEKREKRVPKAPARVQRKMAKRP